MSGIEGSADASSSQSPAGPFELTAALSNMSDFQSLIIASSVLRRVKHCLRTCGAIALCRSSRRLLARSLPTPSSWVPSRVWLAVILKIPEINQFCRLFGGTLLTSGSQVLFWFLDRSVDPSGET